MASVYYKDEVQAPDGVTVLLVESVEERSSQSGQKYFKMTCRDLASDGVVVENCSLSPRSGWKMARVCDSANLIRPNGGFEINSSDLEGRVVYGEIQNTPSTKSGKLYADFKRFLTRAEALALKPNLENVAIPDDALTEPEELRPPRVRGGSRRPAAPEVEPDDIDF